MNQASHQQELEHLFGLIGSQVIRFAEAAQIVGKSIAQVQEQLQGTLDPLAKSQANLQDRVNAFIQAFQKILEINEKLPALTRDVVASLAKRGWYLSLEMSLSSLNKLLELLSSGDTEQIERFMETYYSGQITQIQKDLEKKYPERAHIMTNAFAAHRREEYNLSVPIFLAQADGICFQVIDKKLFSKHKVKPQTAQFVENMVTYDTIMAALLEPLRIATPISASIKELESVDYDNILNRHAILHGTSTTYGTLGNSLKAISLLHYIATVLASVNSHQGEITPKQPASPNCL